ncbi:ribonuclease HII [Clostridia bacterium]|nr:ribonuclease HII [Clostridia bacterium]
MSTGKNQPLTYDYENSSGYSIVAGTDEAGRGPLAGDVYAAAVILPRGLFIPGLNDSKKVSPGMREKLYDVITREAVSYAVATASVDEIDAINILNAAMLAMRRAVDALNVPPEFVLIDGNCERNFEAIPHACIISGDAKSPSVAAASILAKVSRDRYMTALDAKYPLYGFASHKGYPTKTHIEAIQNHGACEVHRRTFLRKILP